MEIFAFASFAILVVGWIVAPSRTAIASREEAEERAAA
jgi:hypothetical protein